jgi:hypothetical protein
LIAADLLAEFASPISIEERNLLLTASLGVSFYPDNALNPEELIRQADTAMYIAKSTGKNNYTIFATQFGAAVQERMELEIQLRGALAREECCVHFQPQFKALAHRLIPFEALARWNHRTCCISMIPMAACASTIRKKALRSQTLNAVAATGTAPSSCPARLPFPRATPTGTPRAAYSTSGACPLEIDSGTGSMQIRDALLSGFDRIASDI